MSALTIYKFGSTLARATIEPDTSSQQQVTLMNEDILSLNFSSTYAIQFQIGDYALFIGKLYQINKLPKRTKSSSRNYQYNLQMESEMYDLGKVDYFFLDESNVFTEPVFTLRARLQDFGDLIIYNLKRVFPTANWILGQVLQTDYATIDFSAQNCLQVLQTLAKTFNTEYLIEGKTINLFQRQTSSGLVLEQGKDKPLLSLTEADQDASNVITRLYAYGSTRNITPSYRDGAQRLRMGTTNYIEKNVDRYRLNEFVILFDGTNGNQEIYPHRTGTVSAIDDPLNFYDTSMNFDLNAPGVLIPGVTAQVVFNTGLLSGYTFDISAYDTATKKFTINQNTEETSFIVPSDTYPPHVGDNYVIININLPQPYVDQAEADLRAAAQTYIDAHSVPPVVYSGVCNAKWFKDNNRSFNLGESAQVLDEDMNIDKITRITAYTRNFQNIYLYTLTLSDTVLPQSLIVKLINGL